MVRTGGNRWKGKKGKVKRKKVKGKEKCPGKAGY
jgi:hypothetical protein